MKAHARVVAISLFVLAGERSLASVPEQCRGAIDIEPYELSYSLSTASQRDASKELQTFRIFSFILKHELFYVTFNHQKAIHMESPPIYGRTGNIYPKPELFLIGSETTGINEMEKLRGRHVAVSIRDEKDGRFFESVGRIRFNQDKNAYYFKLDEKYDSAEPLFIGKEIRAQNELVLYAGIHDGEKWITAFRAPMGDLSAALYAADREMEQIGRQHICVSGNPFGFP